MSNTKIAIAGASGKMGRLIAQALLRRHPNIQINAIARSPEKVDATLQSNPNVHIFRASSDDSSALRKALADCDVCICTYLGDDNLMVQGQKTLIDACIAEKVPRYVGSDYSFDFRGLKKGDHPGKDWMLEYSAYLDEKDKKGDIKAVHVLNGAFVEVIFSGFIGYYHPEGGDGNGMFTYFGTGNEPLEMSTMRDTAEFVAEVAVDPNANGYRNVLGDSKSVKELAQVYEEVYGVQPAVQYQGTLDDLHQKMREAYKKEPGNIFAWMGLHYQYYMANGSTRMGKTENDRLGDYKVQGVKEFLQSLPREKVADSFSTI